MMQMLSGSAKPNNPLAMVAEFRKFEAEINRLLSSGQMSKEQFANLQEQAKMFAQFLR